jgi:hypothetical protein
MATNAVSLKIGITRRTRQAESVQDASQDCRRLYAAALGRDPDERVAPERAGLAAPHELEYRQEVITVYNISQAALQRGIRTAYYALYKAESSVNRRRSAQKEGRPQISACPSRILNSQSLIPNS